MTIINLQNNIYLLSFDHILYYMMLTFKLLNHMKKDIQII